MGRASAGVCAILHHSLHTELIGEDAARDLQLSLSLSLSIYIYI